jgi:arylsulfatase A-like enzyme
LASVDFTPNGVELKAERRKPSGEKHGDIEDIPSLTGVLAHFRLHSFNAIRIYASGAQTPSYHPSNDPPSPPVTRPSEAVLPNPMPLKNIPLLTAIIITLWSFLAKATEPQQPPNIVIIYADDLGYGDLSTYNPQSAYSTPRIDQFANQGIKFLDAHSPCTICSPSRYGLLSGQLVCRTGRKPTAFEGPGGPSYLAPGELTLAQMLQQRGYRTGVFGKWHLGLTWFDQQGKRLAGGFQTPMQIDYAKSTPLVDGPNARGFDESWITPNCPTTDPLYIYIHNGNVPAGATKRHRSESLPNLGGKWLWDNDEGWMAEGYRFADADLLFFDKTAEFIRAHRKQTPEKPFLAILSTQIAHAPVLPAEEFRGSTQAGPRGDFVRELDALTGRLLDLLQELNIDENTLVIFNADNGAETLHTHWMRTDHQHDPAGGFRGMKRDGWEGGHHVPMIMRWPSKIPAGQISDQMINTTDLFATLASIIDFELPDEVAVDSYDMLPVLLGRQPADRQIRPWMLTQSFRGEFQLRVGKWKLLAHRGSGGNDYSRGELRSYALPEEDMEAAGQLYNLELDPGETRNLYSAEEVRVEEMIEILQRTTAPKTGRTAPEGRKPQRWQ